MKQSVYMKSVRRKRIATAEENATNSRHGHLDPPKEGGKLSITAAMNRYYTGNMAQP